MTNEMLFDIIDRLHRKVKILTVLCIVLAIIATAFIVLFFVEFEVTTELVVDETTQVALQQDTGEGGGSNIAIIDSNITQGEEEMDDAYIWLCCVIGCAVVAISSILVVKYGKTKNYHKKEKD